jgi:HD domain
MTTTIAGIKIPDSAMARAATEFVRDTEPDLLYHHSRRVFLFGALAGEREQIKYDAELLYIGAMFHDIGLVEAYSSKSERFEIDGANAARNFLKQYGVNEYDIEQVWASIALHTTPGIPKHMKPVVALVTAGVEMDVLGMAYDTFTESQRVQVVHAHPRVETFKNDIIDAFARGTIHKPETTFGNVKADVLALRDPAYKRMNFCQIILGSAWDDRPGDAHGAGCGCHDHSKAVE